jgi:hypothetical protein
VLFTCNRHHHLIQVPLIPGTGQPAANLVGKALTELQTPLPHRLVADDNAAGGNDLIDIAQAERKAEIQLYGETDDLGREAKATIGIGRGRHAQQVAMPTRARQPDNTAAAGVAVGTTYATLPSGCAYTPSGGAPYYHCSGYGGYWLSPAYGANGVYYQAVAVP